MAESYDTARSLGKGSAHQADCSVRVFSSGIYLVVLALPEDSQKGLPNSHSCVRKSELDRGPNCLLESPLRLGCLTKAGRHGNISVVFRKLQKAQVGDHTCLAPDERESTRNVTYMRSVVTAVPALWRMASGLLQWAMRSG